MVPSATLAVDSKRLKLGQRLLSQLAQSSGPINDDEESAAGDAKAMRVTIVVRNEELGLPVVPLRDLRRRKAKLQKMLP